MDSSDQTELDTDEATQARTDGLRRELQRLKDVGCVVCSRPLCGHQVLFSVAMGVKDAPRCLGCLAEGMDRAVVELRDQLSEHMQHRDCYRQVWAEACQQEGFAPTPHPDCLWPWTAMAEASRTTPPDEEKTHPEQTQKTHPAVWDAGQMSCGDLVLALRIRLQSLPAGSLLRVIARDPAAPEDLPAWCRLTGHRLLQASHPEYLIQRKDP